MKGKPRTSQRSERLVPTGTMVVNWSVFNTSSCTVIDKFTTGWSGGGGGRGEEGGGGKRERRGYTLECNTYSSGLLV